MVGRQIKSKVAVVAYVCLEELRKTTDISAKLADVD
jgi:hypothetical protein